MRLKTRKELYLYQVIAFLLLGLVSGMQIALYMYDYYDDGVADLKSLWIGIAMLLGSIGLVLYSFRTGR